MNASNFNLLSSCPFDLLALITNKLAPKDILNLYLCDKSVIRYRLVEGGVKRFRVDGQTRSAIPLLPFKFKKLQELQLIFPNRYLRPEPGLMSGLPGSLTSLHLQFDYSQSCWLQPASNHTNSNDESNHHVPILLDQILPNLKHLSLICTTWEQYSYEATSQVKHASNGDTSQANHPSSNGDTSSLQRNCVKWNDEMRAQFLAHFPRSLQTLQLGILSQFYLYNYESTSHKLYIEQVSSSKLPSSKLPSSKLPSSQLLSSPDASSSETTINSLELLPQHLTSLILSPPNNISHIYLSKIPDNLKKSLTNLTIGVVDRATNLDGDLPSNLKCLHFVSRSYPRLVLTTIPSLPFNLHTLTFTDSSYVVKWDCLPSTLTCLQLGETSFSQSDLPHLPKKLTHLSLHSFSNFESLDNLPESLLTLELLGNNYISDQELSKLPRFLTSLHLSGVEGYQSDEASLLLPQHLKSLRLGPCSSNWTEQAIQNLPRSITELELQPLHLNGNCFKYLPPKLERLTLLKSYFITEEHLKLLPKTLLKFKTRTVIVTGTSLPQGETIADTKTFNQSFLKNYPILFSSKTGKLRPELVFDYVMCLPSSITKIELPCKSIGPCESLDQLINDYHSTFSQEETIQEEKSHEESIKSHEESIMSQKPTLGSVLPKLPNLRHLHLPQNCDFHPRDLIHLMSLETLIMPKNYSDAHSHVVLPPNLTKLDVRWTIGNIKYSSSLTHLSIYSLSSKIDFNSNLPNLTYLQIEFFYGFQDSDVELLPRGLLELHLKHSPRLTDAAVHHLPPNLTELDLPVSELSDSCIFSLPRSLTKICLNTLRFQNPEYYQNVPRLTSFSCPNDFIHSFDQFRKLDKSSPSFSRSLSVTKYDVKLSNEMIAALPDSITSFTMSKLNASLRNEHFALLPRSLKSLDLLNQGGKHHDAVALSLLPDGLETLITTCPEVMDPLLFSYLPRTLTKLDIHGVPGRLTPAKALHLPRSLTWLKIGLIIVGNDALPHLPTGLLDIDFPNSLFINDEGAKDLPRCLERLKLPLATFSLNCIPSMPSSLKQLWLGNKSISSAIILEGIKTHSTLPHSDEMVV